MATAQRLKEGALVKIDLGDGYFGFGRVLNRSELAFYDLRSDLEHPVNLEDIYAAPVAFIVAVMNTAVKSGRWQIIDKRPLEDKFLLPRKYFISDTLTGKLSIYLNTDGSIRPANRTECAGLECAAVWEAEHIEDRLKDHFSGRKNIWVEQLKLRNN